MTPIVIATILGFVVSVVEAVGLTVLRKGGPWAIPIASLTYAFLVVPLLSYGLKYEGIGMTNFLWNVFSTILMFAIGIYVFREKVHHLQLIGVLVSLLGIGLILIAPDSGNSTY